MIIIRIIGFLKIVIHNTFTWETYIDKGGTYMDTIQINRNLYKQFLIMDGMLRTYELQAMKNLKL